MMKRIKSHPKYSITPDGQVYSHSYKKFKKLVPNRKNGYYRVQLSGAGPRVGKMVHVLVAEAYVPNPQNLSEVNHIDGNKLNNIDTNLEWCTHSQNVQHAYDNGLVSQKLR